jgi:adenosylcobinamide-phosphate synthase
MPWFIPPGAPHAPEPLLVLLAALALDAFYTGGPGFLRAIPHPVVIAGRAIAWAETRLNRPQRSPTDRRWRGILLCVAMVTLAASIGYGFSWIARVFALSYLIEMPLIAWLLAQRSLHDHVRAVAVALDSGGEEAGREAVSHIVGRDPKSLDQHGVARAAIESLAENFSDAVVAPVFWFVLFGLPGLMVYKTVNTLDSMVGYRSDRYRDFGWASARLDDVLNLIPARLSGLLIAVAALLVPGAKAQGALATMWRDHARHRSPNSGWPEAAMAGALALALAGPRVYPGQPPEGEWIGDGRSEATPGDIRAALRIFVGACSILASMVLCGAIVGASAIQV